ncbi:hypothetical protein TNCV_426631 [Trichonephila clavipes]|nr:hypothetical protein TNCV_426631 [Trichonephila clavipes]
MAQLPVHPAETWITFTIFALDKVGSRDQFDLGPSWPTKLTDLLVLISLNQDVAKCHDLQPVVKHSYALHKRIRLAFGGMKAFGVVLLFGEIILRYIMQVS